MSTKFRGKIEDESLFSHPHPRTQNFIKIGRTVLEELGHSHTRLEFYREDII